MSRDGAERRLRRLGPWIGGAALVVALAALGWRACGRADGAARGDTRFYVRGAARFLAGEDLYWAATHPDGYRPTTGYTYPPPLAAACVWTTLLPYRVLRGVWLVLMTGCALASGALALRLLAARGPPPVRPALALALVAPFALRFGLNDLAHGQTNWLVTLLLAAALLAAARERDARAGAALGAALAIKPTAWPVLAWWLVVERRWRAVAAALAVLTALVLLVPLPRYGLAGTLALLASWVERMQGFAREEAAAPGSAALSATLLRLGGVAQDQVSPSALLTSRALALLAGAAAFAALAPRRRASPAAPAALLALGALLSPVTWKAHLVVLLLPALFAARRLADDPAVPPRAWALWALTVALLTLPSEGLLRLGGLEETGSVALGTALVLWQAAAAPALARVGESGTSAHEAWRLIDCTIYRDGGSYGAVLERGPARVALLLQVGPWDHPAERRYEGLFLSAGDAPTRKERRLEPGGEEEGRWSEVLAACDTRQAQGEARARLRELLAALSSRPTSTRPPGGAA